MNKRQLVNKLNSLIKDVRNTGVKCHDVSVVLRNIQKYNNNYEAVDRSKLESSSDGRRTVKRLSNSCSFFRVSLVIMIILLIPIFIRSTTKSGITLSKPLVAFTENECIIDLDDILTEITRPAMDCTVCRDMKTVKELKDIDEKLFREKYAYTNVPLLVKGAAKDWAAVKSFNFTFFKNLYSSIPGSFDSVENNCQFFRYKTYFATLEDVLNMSEARALNEPGQKSWYIGWCDSSSKAERELKKYYTRPKFLPNTDENFDADQTDWIFMGWPGQGAHIHIDSVASPSWQAQLKGSKTWLLMPSPECSDLCHTMNVTLEVGDILTIDTNQWYHSTFVHPGDMSISVGSEY